MSGRNWNGSGRNWEGSGKDLETVYEESSKRSRSGLGETLGAVWEWVWEWSGRVWRGVWEESGRTFGMDLGPGLEGVWKRVWGGLGGIYEGFGKSLESDWETSKKGLREVQELVLEWSGRDLGGVSERVWEKSRNRSGEGLGEGL